MESSVLNFFPSICFIQKFWSRISRKELVINFLSVHFKTKGLWFLSIIHVWIHVRFIPHKRRYSSYKFYLELRQTAKLHNIHVTVLEEWIFSSECSRSSSFIWVGLFHIIPMRKSHRILWLIFLKSKIKQLT